MIGINPTDFSVVAPEVNGFDNDNAATVGDRPKVDIDDDEVDLGGVVLKGVFPGVPVSKRE